MKKKKKEAIVYEFVEFLLARKPAYAAEMLRASYLASAREFLDSPDRVKPAPPPLDWQSAKRHLIETAIRYAKHGPGGLILAAATVLPVLDRLESGERTKELYDEIMALE